MRYEEYDFDVKATAVETGEANCGVARDTGAFINSVVVLDPGNAGNTLQLQGNQKPAGGQFVAVGDPVTGTTPGAIAVEGAWARLRVKTTAYADGTPTAALSAHNVRTD